MSKIIIFIVAFFIAVLINRTLNKIKEEEKLVIGKKYLHSFYFNTTDPFQKIEIDTCLILNIKNDYTQYKILTKSGGFVMSTKTKYLTECIKEIKP